MLSFGWSPLVRQLPYLPRPLNNPLITASKAPLTIGTIVTFMFHNYFFNSLARLRYFIIIIIISINISIIICSSFWEFLKPALLIFSHWSLSNGKSPRLSRTLLSILANLDRAVVTMVTTYPHIFSCSSSFIYPFWLHQTHQWLLEHSGSAVIIIIIIIIIINYYYYY